MWKVVFSALPFLKVGILILWQNFFCEFLKGRQTFYKIEKFKIRENLFRSVSKMFYIPINHILEWSKNNSGCCKIDPMNFFLDFPLLFHKFVSIQASPANFSEIDSR